MLEEDEKGKEHPVEDNMQSDFVESDLILDVVAAALVVGATLLFRQAIVLT
jgi:hypothetical protein